MSVRTTFAPSTTNDRACDAPMPRAAPLMIAIFPAKRPILSLQILFVFVLLYPLEGLVNEDVDTDVSLSRYSTLLNADDPRFAGLKAVRPCSVPLVLPSAILASRRNGATSVELFPVSTYGPDLRL